MSKAVILGALLLPICASFRITSHLATETTAEDIIDLAGQGAAREFIKGVARASGPTTGAEAFDQRGNVKYDDEWFEEHCDLPTQSDNDKMEGQFTSTSDGQQQMKELIEQVNHMSIDGILRHLLSFYVCMRWVPDERFVKAVKFEMENVNVDSATKASETPLSEDDIYKMYAEFDAIPLKCGSAVHVQDAFSIDQFLEAARNPTSGISQAYEYSEKVASQSTGWLDVKWWTGGNPAKVKETLKEEARTKAETALKVLPFDGFVRPSQQFKWFKGMFKHGTHDSQAKNLFFICFGPRVTSFPHKRENGPHVIADMNMAGCNGLWSLQDIAAHVERVKKLFAPELCLTDNLRTKLKEVFLSTFMEMNNDFFQYMTGQFQKDTGFIEAIPQPLRESGNTKVAIPILSEPKRGASVVRELEKGTAIVLGGYDPDSPGFARVVYPEEGWIEDWMNSISKANTTALDDETEGRVQSKYERSARLLAGAHTKWVVCDAKPGVKHELGFEDNFFRNPKAYAKWLNIEVEKKNPECKLMDPETGCVKCAISVKSDPWRCMVRLGLEPKHVLDALARGDFPLSTKYKIPDLVNQEPNKPPALNTVSGTCLLGRKPAMNISRNNNLKHFANWASDDVVWAVTNEGKDHFKMAPRYTVNRRVKSYQEYLEAKRNDEPVHQPTEAEMIAEVNAMKVWQSQFENSGTTHVNTQLGPLLAYEEHVPQQSNRPSHFVQYIMTCPCEHHDFSQLEKLESFAGAEVTDFFNAGGAF